MLIDPRAFVLIGTNILLLYIMQLLNSACSSYLFYWVLAGPMLVFPALFLSHRSGSFCLLCSGLWIDASTPGIFGSFTISFLIMGTMLFVLRHRFRVEHNYHPLIIAQITNAIVIVLLSLSNGQGNYHVLDLWILTITTFLGSSLLLLFIAPWFFNFQRMLFEQFRMNSEPEDIPIP